MLGKEIGGLDKKHLLLLTQFLMMLLIQKLKRKKYQKIKYQTLQIKLKTEYDTNIAGI